MNSGASQSRNLFLVSTAYHVHVASELIASNFANDENVVISSSSISSNAILKHETCRLTGAVRVIHAQFSAQGTFPRRSAAILMSALLFSRFGLFLGKRVRSIAGLQPDRLFVFSPNALTLLVRSLYPSAEVYLCEEGLASYDGTILGRTFYLDNKIMASCRASRFLLQVNKVLFDESLFLRPKGIYLHQPSLATADYPFSIMQIRVGQQETKTSCKMTIDGAARRQWRVIFLGQAVEGGSYDHVKRDDMLFEAVSRCMPGLIYRKHPRDKRKYRDRALDSTADWELFCAEFDADHTVLVSDFSTAAAIPKLVCGKEPRLLFLFDYQCEERSALTDGLQEFFARFTSEYSHRERIITPRTPMDLADACKRICLLIQKEGANER